MLYKTVVEVKDWKEALKQGEVIKFKAVLDDLPDQPRGIMVSRLGFQRGALKVAAANGILLYELREPNEDDLKGRVRCVDLELTTYFSRASAIRLLHDEDWRISEARRLGLNEAPRINLRLEPAETQLLDSDGNQLRTVQDVINGIYPNGFHELAATSARHDFTEPTFLATNDSAFPKLRVSALEATICTTALKQQIVSDVGEVVLYILRDTLSGAVRTFDPWLRLRPDSPT